MQEITDFTFPDSLAGQLFAKERKALYDSIKDRRPEMCLECGTWSGLGSTYFLAHALKENDLGRLHTFDVKPWEKYGRTPEENLIHFELADRVSFHLEDFIEGVKKLDLNKVDFVFLDGPEESDYTLNSFLFLEDLMPQGSVVFVHDWNTASDKPQRDGETPKCEAIKKYLDDSKDKWELSVIVPDTPSGLAKITKK